MQILVPVIATALLAGCGRTEPRPATQPVETWYAEAFVPLADLSTAYTALSRVKSGSMKEIARQPQIADIRRAATAGLKVAAPAGHPELDTAYDKVMRDSLAVVEAVGDNSPAAFARGTVRTLEDMDTLNRRMARVG
jgi:hypothetical protein